jgi:hypothetical protein
MHQTQDQQDLEVEVRVVLPTKASGTQDRETDFQILEVEVALRATLKIMAATVALVSLLLGIRLEHYSNDTIYYGGI